MAHVFDYDPMVAGIQTLAGSDHRATQERLVSELHTYVQPTET